MATGVAPADLGAARSHAIHERLFTPAGMPGVILGSDPRGLSDDYAAGHQFDLRARAGAIPYAPFGAYGPAGAGYVNIEDMTAWVRLQLRQGVSVNGRRVVSAANLAECWKPHVPASLLPPELDPDAVSVGYAMGWIREEYKGGSSLVWHNGAFDGFTAFVGFLPQHDLGLTVLPDGSYVMSEGFMVGAAVKLARETDGTPHIEIVGIETVRRTTGLG